MTATATVTLTAAMTATLRVAASAALPVTVSATAPASVAARVAAGAPELPGDRLLEAVSGLVHAVTSRFDQGDQVWLLAVAAAGVMAAVMAWHAGRGRLHRWRHRRLAAHAQQVVISPPPEADPAGAALWWANVAGILRPSPWRRLVYGAPHIGMEYRWAGRQLRIVVWVPATVPAGQVAAAVRAAWPGASATIQDAGPPVPFPAADTATDTATDTAATPGTPSGERSRGTRIVREAGGALVPLLPAWYPSAPSSDLSVDPLRALIEAGAALHASEAACVQILARPASPRATARARAGAAALKTGRPASSALAPERLLGSLAGGLLDVLTPGGSSASRRAGSHASPGQYGPRAAGSDPLRERDARPGLEKVAAPLWEVAIRYAVTHTSTSTGLAASTADSTISRTISRTGSKGRVADGVGRRLAVLAGGLASAMAVHDGRNRFRRMRLAHPARVLAERSMRSGFLLSGEELVPMAGLPADLAVPGLDRARAKAVPAPIAVPAGGRDTKTLGRAQVGGHAVALPVTDARQHVHVLGSTGVGKSTFLANLILQDVRARRSTVLIDPKGDLALEVLALLPDEALERLILIDPDQPSGSAHFNPLQLKGRSDGADADVIVDHLVSIFASIFQRHWGPRIDDVLRVACLTLMRHRDPRLSNVPPLLMNKQFRAPFTVGLDDPEGLLGFWQWYESTPPQLRAQVIGPVLARLRSFLLRDFIKRTVGRPSSSFDMTRVLNSGGILIARLPKGQLGDDASRLLGSLLLASVWQAATGRARQPEDRRKDAVVYVDEAHNVLNLAGSVADILAEARGYRLSMVLAHQDLAQLPRETQLAISANARNKVFFNCSPEDARQLARHTLPELDEHDLAHLDAYTAACRLMIGNRETAAFTLTTNPPPVPPGPPSERAGLSGPEGPGQAELAGRLAQGQLSRAERLERVRASVARTGPDGEPAQAEPAQAEQSQAEQPAPVAAPAATAHEDSRADTASPAAPGEQGVQGDQDATRTTSDPHHPDHPAAPPSHTQST